MKELLRNCEHGSEILLYKESKDNQENYIKVAYSEEGKKNLHQEYAGWKWYNSKLKEDVSVNYDEASGYARLVIPKLSGEQGRFYSSMQEQLPLLNKVSEHYSHIWKVEDSPLHGDLSLENILFDGDRVYVLDWEHFDENQCPLGFDFYHMIFEALVVVTYRKENRFPEEQDLIVCKEVIQRFRQKHKETEWIQNKSFRKVYEFMVANKSLWGQQIEQCYTKFPVLDLALWKIDKIDSFIDA